MLPSTITSDCGQYKCVYDGNPEMIVQFTHPEAEFTLTHNDYQPDYCKYNMVCVYHRHPITNDMCFVFNDEHGRLSVYNARGEYIHSDCCGDRFFKRVEKTYIDDKCYLILYGWIWHPFDFISLVKLNDLISVPETSDVMLWYNLNNRCENEPVITGCQIKYDFFDAPISIADAIKYLNLIDIHHSHGLQTHDNSMLVHVLIRNLICKTYIYEHNLLSEKVRVYWGGECASLSDDRFLLNVEKTDIITYLQCLSTLTPYTQVYDTNCNTEMHYLAYATHNIPENYDYTSDNCASLLLYMAMYSQLAISGNRYTYQKKIKNAPNKTNDCTWIINSCHTCNVRSFTDLLKNKCRGYFDTKGNSVIMRIIFDNKFKSEGVYEYNADTEVHIYISFCNK